MKRFKAFIILIICVLLIVTIGKLTFAEDTRKEIDIATLKDNDGIMKFSGQEWKDNYANIHCVQRGTSFKSGYFKITATAKISGDKVTLINYGKGFVGGPEGWNYPNSIKEETVTVEGSNILAAILTTANFSHGYRLNGEERVGNRSDAQLAIWYYWNIWSKNLPNDYWKTVFPYHPTNEKGLNEYYKEGKALIDQGVFEAYDENNANMKIKDYLYIKNDEGVYEKPENGVYKDGIQRYRKVSSGASEVASAHEYNATIHLMQFYYPTSDTNKNDNSQRIIVYESGPAIKKLSLEKDWDDGENKFTTRPDSITAQITAYKMTGNKYEPTDVQVYKENADGTLYVDEKGDYMRENEGYVDEKGDYVNEKEGYVREKGGYVRENKGETYEVVLSKNNNWQDEIRILAKSNETDLIYYGIKEVEVDGYELDNAECYREYDGTKIDMSTRQNFMADDEIVATQWNAHIKLTNKLKDEVNVKAIKVWDDKEDLDGYRPKSVVVTLKENGNLTDKKGILSESNNWTYTFEGLEKYKKDSTSGEWSQINYEIVEDEIIVGNEKPYEAIYDEKIVTKATENEPETITYKITNKHEPHYDGYYEIKGTVWNDGHATKGNAINGTLGPEDVGIPGIKVTLMYGNSAFYSDEKGNVISSTTTTANGEYTIKVNYDNSSKVYKLYESSDEVERKLSDGKAWVMFEYDGMLYTTVRCDTELTAENTSKARERRDGQENEERRFIDESYDIVNTSTPEIEYYNQEIDGTNKTIPAIDYKQNSYWNKVKITASTQGVIKSFTDYKLKNTDNGVNSRKEKETIRYCNGDTNGDGIEEYIKTNPTGAWNTIVNGKHDCTNCDAKGHGIREFEVDVTTINGVNLGLFEREQPKVGIFSDLSKVQVEMNGQRYTYLYGVRSKGFPPADIKTQFQNKDEYTYQRPVNPADIAYIQEDNNEYTNNEDAMSVFVTYEIEVGNLSTTLPIQVDNIINVYDLGYNKPTITIERDGKTIAIEYITSNIYGSEEFNEITLNNLGLTIQPNSRSEKIQITYEVSKEEIRGLFEGHASLHNAVEIHTYSTTYGELTLRAEENVGIIPGYNEYAGYDYETHPGNAAITIDDDATYTDKDNNEYQAAILISTKDGTTKTKIVPERDTDISPSFILCKDDEPKTLSGTVFEDKDSNTADEERLGDGKYNNEEEKTVENVMVELYKIIRDDDGNITGADLAKLYKEDTNLETGEHKAEGENARVYSNSDGTYALEGVVTGEYFLKFTYGNYTEEREDKTKELEYATTMDGGETTINARNYKSTIITNESIKKLFELDYESPEFDKKWHINIEDNYSVAVDNMKDRLQIEDLQNSNFYIGENMTAYSKPFETQVEFEETGEAQVNKEEKLIDKEGNEISNVLSKLDFGIIERPREDVFIQKRVTNLKITLANGQVLTEGNPSKQTLNYVKTMGQGQIFENSHDARDFERRILVEMDAELIQGSQIEVGYEVVVKNNNEKDYDYGTKDDYADLIDLNETMEYDKYITKNPKADYYYYGKSDGLQEMKTTIEIVDYLSNDVVYDEPTEGMPIIWEEKQFDELKRDGLISDDTFETLEKGKNYRIFKLAANEGKITLARGASSEMFTMSASKRLANKDENIYDNHVEIIKIDGKSARTIETVEIGTDENGKIIEKIIEKSYIPGDYVPTLDAKNSQQDDDKVSVILTNATGITNYVITYLITGLIGLIVLVIGIAFIKKVLLKK